MNKNKEIDLGVVSKNKKIYNKMININIYTSK